MTANSSSHTPHLVEECTPRAENISDLLKVFSHDCRGDLVSMGAALTLLEKGFYGALEETAKEEVRKVSRRTAKMIGMLEDTIVQTLAIKNEACLRFDEVSLGKDILEPLLQELSQDIPRERFLVVHHPLEAAREDDPRVKGNRFLLRSVFRNLMRNADAYGAKQKKVIIRITRMDRYVIIDVCNQGSPLRTEDQKDFLTESKGPRTGSSAENQGLGIGLSLVQKIVESHGGRIWYRAEKNASHFLFSLFASQEPN